MIRFNPVFVACLACALAVGECAAQAPQKAAQKAPAVDYAAMVKRAAALAQQGRCQEALPDLRKGLLRITDKELKYKTAFGAAQCAMALGQTEAALELLSLLNRDFPDDPHVLYVTAHFCSMLAELSAKELAEKAPTSYQAQQLATTGEDARKEFEAEIKIDPNNAAAEYMLANLARQAQQWDVAIVVAGRERMMRPGR
jgi:tetratricopeptide (TPR) repeat protein